VAVSWIILRVNQRAALDSILSKASHFQPLSCTFSLTCIYISSIRRPGNNLSNGRSKRNLSGLRDDSPFKLPAGRLGSRTNRRRLLLFCSLRRDSTFSPRPRCPRPCPGFPKASTSRPAVSSESRYRQSSGRKSQEATAYS
jgi:hypothetical protein